jgi:hypothetical protein
MSEEIVASIVRVQDITILKMERAHSSEMLMYIYKTTCPHMPEDNTLISALTVHVVSNVAEACEGLTVGFGTFITIFVADTVQLHFMRGCVLEHRKKGNAIPVTGRGGPLGCETSRLPLFL